MTYETILRNERRLVRVYDAWLARTKLPAMSADELLHELFDREPRDSAQEHWLQRFIDIWNKRVDVAH